MKKECGNAAGNALNNKIKKNLDAIAYYLKYSVLDLSGLKGRKQLKVYTEEQIRPALKELLVECGVVCGGECCGEMEEVYQNKLINIMNREITEAEFMADREPE